MRVAAVVLAAGRGSRMGADKLGLAWGEGSLLDASVRPLLACPQLCEVVVVVGEGSRVPAGCRAVICQDPAEGMAASLRAGVAGAPGVDAWLLALGDMPAIDTSTVDSVVSALVCGASIAFPTWNGRRGHPVGFSARHRSALLALRGDQGARKLLLERRDEAIAVPVDDPGVVLDIDTPADLAAHHPRRLLGEGRPRVLIKGAGEHASGTAHRLFSCGYRVVMTELPEPRAVRLGASFCTAVWDGTAQVEGVRARRWSLAQASELRGFAWDHVPLFVDPAGELLAAWRPEVVVDARIAKRNLDNSLDQAPLVIGMGPGLVAGRDVHAVIESNRGHDLGRILWQGQAQADTGVPGDIGGVSAGRVLRAPGNGLLERRVELGAMVSEGQPVATVAGAEVAAGTGGVVRGLMRSGTWVAAGEKVGDVDPRGEVAWCTTLSDKTRNLSGAVLEILVSRFPG